MSHIDAQLRELILSLVPDNGSTIGNARLLALLSGEAAEVEKADYERVRDGLIEAMADPLLPDSARRALVQMLRESGDSQHNIAGAFAHLARFALDAEA